MTDKTFSMTEALKHGMAMTRKHLGFVAIIIAIYGLYSFATGTLEALAGKGDLRKDEVLQLYGKDPAHGEMLYAFLLQERYISEGGSVQPKLSNMRRPAELSLPEELEKNRDAIFAFLVPYTYRLPFPRVVYLVIVFLLWIIDMLMQIGLLSISIMLSRDEKPQVAEIFSNPDLLIPYFLSGLCFGLAVLGGFILLIIPGFILMVMLGMYPYFIVDQGKGPIEALKASRALTKGARWKLFAFGWLAGLFNLAGLLCLVVGVLFTIPATCIAYAYVYDKLSAAGSAEETPPTVALS